MAKYDRRRKYYLVLDCETATLPCASGYNGENRKKIAIAKPLVYDLGWKVIDIQGRVYARKNYLISEIFSVPEIFNTAYYASKRPIYIERLRKGEIRLTSWDEAIKALLEDIEAVEAIGAYNAVFDLKKAIPFTELYIRKLYSDDFHDWLNQQSKFCNWIVNNDSHQKSKKTELEKQTFIFRNVKCPIFDIWGLSCEYLLNCDDYKNQCIYKNWKTPTGKYFSTSAENAYRFVSDRTDFDESHTAIDDADIEVELFALAVKNSKKKWQVGIIHFPFRLLGTVEDFLEN